MKQLLALEQHDIDPTAHRQDTSAFRRRFAARAVLADADGRIHLLHVTNHGYHKLPGGGIEAGENIPQALERELMEEVGCEAEVIAELGTVMESRVYEDGGLNQVSYCFVARQRGEQQESALDEWELGNGMVAVTAPNIEAAIELLHQDTPDDVNGKFIQKRDLCILNAAKEYLQG